MNVTRNITLDAALDEARRAYAERNPKSPTTHVTVAGELVVTRRQRLS